jgi:heme/copper-type cytochrome/quinol oxidase subunit 3
VFADSRPTWLQAGLWTAIATVCAIFGVLLFTYQVL